MGKIAKAWREINRYRQTFNLSIMWYQLLDKVLTKLDKTGLAIFRPLIRRGFQAKHQAILKYLEGDFADFLANYDFRDQGQHHEPVPPRIFSLWFQGRQAAPALVQATLASQEAFAQRYGYEWIFLTQENLGQYFQVPKAIKDKVESGQIDYVKLSDLIRCCLIAEGGGAWFDSTLLVTTENDLDYLGLPFYTMPAQGKEWYPKYVANNRWAMFCLVGAKDSLVFRFLRDFQVAYFSKYSLPVDYFLIDYLLDIGYRYSSAIKELVDAVPKNNQDLYFVADHINEVVDEAQWDSVKAQTQLYKCTYKIAKIEDGDTYYHRLVQGDLSR